MSLLIQFVKGCNLWQLGGCSYCFYGESIPAEITIMQVDLFKDILSQHVQTFPGQEIEVYAVGGESFLGGIEYFKKILTMERGFTGISFNNYLQTNATLITNEWVAFLKENDIKTGVSMDALPELHDQFRCGSLKAVLGGIKKLRAVGIPLSAISVINNTSLKYLLAGDNIKKHFDFFLREKIRSWGYNPYVTHNPLDPERVDPNEYGLFLKRVIDYWLGLPPEPIVSIREVDDLLCIAEGKVPRGCAFSGECARYLTIDVGGIFRPCERLIGLEDIEFGNVSNNGLNLVYKSEAYKVFLEKTRKLPDQCLSCKLKNKCNNGCTAMRDAGGKFLFCEAIKKLSAYLKEVIESARTTESCSSKDCPDSQLQLEGVGVDVSLE